MRAIRARVGVRSSWLSRRLRVRMTGASGAATDLGREARVAADGNAWGGGRAKVQSFMEDLSRKMKF
ncbi:hypothetical protein GCM10008955_36810 [Deinococcus malanensis]|uniref:Uncharacterized protein n=1 Tax=Deinococcus malanensis TaxID=1706855 RepID=A0ABQ2F150_9DEIO|nr:hypothetical protein GCM10008955_36810 [Deinococcus malanensis]